MLRGRRKDPDDQLEFCSGLSLSTLKTSTHAARRCRSSRKPFSTRTSTIVMLSMTKRAKPGARVDRVRLRQVDLHWHDLRHQGACRLLAVDIRIIQLMLGHASRLRAARYGAQVGAGRLGPPRGSVGEFEGRQPLE